MRLWKNILLVWQVAAVVAVPISASCQTLPKPLEVAAKSVIAAPREDRVLMLVDVNAHKNALLALGEPERKAALIATALHYAAQSLHSGKFDAKFNTVEVILAMVENMDEYARPNFGGMLRLGNVSVKKADGGKVEMTAETVQPGQIK